MAGGGADEEVGEGAIATERKHSRLSLEGFNLAVLAAPEATSLPASVAAPGLRSAPVVRPFEVRSGEGAARSGGGSVGQGLVGAFLLLLVGGFMEGAIGLGEGDGGLVGLRGASGHGGRRGISGRGGGG